MRIVDRLRTLPQRLEAQHKKIKKRMFVNYYKQAKKSVDARSVDYPNLEKILKTEYHFPDKVKYPHVERSRVINYPNIESVGNAVPNSNTKDFKVTRSSNPNSLNKGFIKGGPKQKAVSAYQKKKAGIKKIKNNLTKEFSKESLDIKKMRFAPAEKTITNSDLNKFSKSNMKSGKDKTSLRVTSSIRYKNTGGSSLLKPIWKEGTTNQIFLSDTKPLHDYAYRHPADRLVNHYAKASKNFERKLVTEAAEDMMKRDAFKLGAGVAIAGAVGGAAYYAYKAKKKEKNNGR
jgi:hypothetical protein